MVDYSNALIFGKNQTKNIVCVEASEDGLILFKEINGKLEYEVLKNTFWLLTNEQVSSRQTELKGNQHFKWIAEFDTFAEKMKARQIVKNNKVSYWDIFNPKEASLVYNGLTYFKGLNPKDVSVLSWDIETTGLVHNDSSKVLLISNTLRKNGIITKKLFAYDDYKNQKQLLEAWCTWVREMDPSLIIGHNIYGFDFQYLKFVAKENRTKLSLGRDDSTIHFDPYTSSYRVDGSQEIDYYNAHIFGREIVDTMFLARKYDIAAKNYVSYALKTIIEQEGLQKKDRVFYDASKIRENYTIPNEWEKIKAYAIDDADDALALFDLMVPSFFYFTQSVSKPFQMMINGATGSQINNIMVRSYLQMGHSIAKADDAYHFEGATSFGISGIYKNCFKVDVASLYPSIIRQYGIYNKNKDPYKHFLEMVEYFTIERLKNKKLAKETGLTYYKDLEQSQKISINSAYGFLGAPGLNYNYIPGADEVTRRGREVLQIASKYATGKNIEFWEEKAN